VALIQRPLKQGSVRTFAEKVALGFDDALDVEFDGDVDTLYAEVNGNLSDPNILNAGITASTKLVAGSITAGVIASNAVETAKIKDLNVTVGKLAVKAGTNIVGAGAQVSTTWSTVETTVASVTMTTRGGNVLLVPALMIPIALATASAFNLTLRWYRGVTLLGNVIATIQGAVGDTVLVTPYPRTDVASSAGSNTWHLKALTSTTNAVITMSGAANGEIQAMEFA